MSTSEDQHLPSFEKAPPPRFLLRSKRNIFHLPCSLSPSLIADGRLELFLSGAKQFPYDREDERFVYKLFNCFGAKDNRERIFSWQSYVLSSAYLPVKTCFPGKQERKLLKERTVAQEKIMPIE
ncbi:hypothetical protein TNIN_128901 [Trichonephila inaurata madagascariensis]|uniref:Uncharacterized protein n=1 Tax=Trichonephila inaurata madagascariensis TaxID=2747483 RepID=A0A8X7CSU4_9ARAC|nr:hypothetical protein TNIN_128901 [Trichonephila inaurata madagascariensis]